MIILLPFKLLKIRERFKREYDSYTKNGANEKLQSVVQELRDIYERDIIKTIEASFKNEEISRHDMGILIKLTIRLFDYLYSKYSSLEEVDNMLYDQSLDLDIDRYMDRIEALEEEVSKKDEELAKNADELAKNAKLIAQLQEKLKKYKS